MSALEKAKQEVLDAIRQEGAISGEDYRNIDGGLDYKDSRELYLWMTDNHYKIANEDECYLANLKTKEEKILFCYFMFVNWILDNDESVDAFDINVATAQKICLDDFLDTLPSLEKQIVRTERGLDNGEPCWNQEELFHVIGNCSLETFIYSYSAVYRLFNNNGLISALKAIKAKVKTPIYGLGSVPDPKERILLLEFSPDQDGGEKADCFFPYIQSTYDMDANSSSTCIGYGEDGSLPSHCLWSYADGRWGFALFDRQDTRVGIRFENGKLIFDCCFSNSETHGRKYILESGKNTIIEEYYKGTRIYDTEIDFQLDADLANIFPMGVLPTPELCDKKENHAKIEPFGFRALEIANIEKDGLKAGLVSSFEKGTSTIGFFNAGRQLEKTHMTYCPGDASFEYSASSGACIYFKTAGNKCIHFVFHDKNGVECVFVYQPRSQLLDDELDYYAYGNGSNEDPTEVAHLSSPFYKRPISKETNYSDDPGAIFDNLIGLDNVKVEIRRLRALLAKRKTSRRKTNLSMVFVGNPGTGKTKVAKLLAKILFRDHFLESDKVVEINRETVLKAARSDMEGNLRSLIDTAIGGTVLVESIDEIFSDGTFDGMGNVGKRATAMFTKFLNDYYGRICFIFTSHALLRPDGPDAISFLGEINPDRFITFPDCSEEELSRLADAFAKENGYVFGQDAKEEITRLLIGLLKEDSAFANGTTVRNFLEELYQIQAERTYDQPDNMTIELIDVQTYEKDCKIALDPQEGEMAFPLTFDEFKESQKKADSALSPERLEEATVKIIVQKEGKTIGSGTGFLILENGLIATCAHVIANEEAEYKVTVTFVRGNGQKVSKTYDGKPLGRDDAHDVGLLAISDRETTFSFIKLDDGSEFPSPLTPVLMAGYPLGSNRFKNLSINEGKVQSVNHDLMAEEDGEGKVEYILLDISGHPGNSGSAVIAKETSLCIGILSGAASGGRKDISGGIVCAVPIRHLWTLLFDLFGKKDEHQPQTGSAASDHS